MHADEGVLTKNIAEVLPFHCSCIVIVAKAVVIMKLGSLRWIFNYKKPMQQIQDSMV